MAGGRDIAPAINQLLSLPFILKVATRDFHPADHVSFSTAHPPPNNKPFESSVNIHNPQNDSQEQSIPIWPPHCVQGTTGAEIIPEIDTSKLHAIVEKGRDKRLEMFSGFADVFGNRTTEAASIDLAALLKSQAISHAFVVGVAGDFCVKCTALDARQEGLETIVVADAVKSIDPGADGWGKTKQELEGAGISIVNLEGPEVARVRNLG